MRNSYAFLHRADVRAGLLALALGCVSLTLEAAPVNSGNVGRMGLSGNGRTTTLTPGAPPTNSGGSTIPIAPQSGGWTRAGNYGVPPSATGPNAGTITANGDVVFRDSYKNGQNSWDVNGIKYPAQTSTPIPWGAVGGAAAGIVCAVATAGACGVASGVAIAAPYIMDWIERAGMRRNPDTGNIEGPQGGGSPTQSDGFEYRYSKGGGTYSNYWLSPESMCLDWADWWNGVNSMNTGQKIIAPITFSTMQCHGKLVARTNESQVVNPNFVTSVERRTSNCPATWFIFLGACYSAQNLPREAYTPEQVASKLGSVAPDPRVWGEVLDKGGTVDLPNPTVTGPTSIQGPETVKQNSDGSREVSRTTYNFTTNGNTITNTSNVTTNNTYNSSNVQTSSTTTTTTPSENTPQEEPKDPCDKHPTALGCKDVDFDTPDGKVPKESKDVSFQAESVLGGGSCPADVYASVTTLGTTLKVWDWQATCNYFLPIRFILMALAAFSAVLIILPGGKSA